jgi:hypothetical protein
VPLPSRGELSIRSSDPGHVIAAYNPIIVACFARQATLAELATLRALAAEGLDAGIRGGLLLVVARKELSSGIDPGARRFFEQMVRENSARSGVSAVVVLTEGFASAVLRGFVAGLLQLTTRRKTLQIFSSVAEACRWLAPHHGLDERALESAYQRATSHLAGAARR